MPAVEIVAGVDEAGRGPLAGPVVSAAVILDPRVPIAGLTDSKKLSEKRRETLDRQIRSRACWCIATASVEEIDRMNIHHATLLALRRAVLGLSQRPERVWVDGKFTPRLAMPVEAIVGGDASHPAISAASILAKQYRDRLLKAFNDRYPGYGFASHKGYPTRAHIDAIEQLGVLPIHRRSFAPVRQRLGGAL